MLPNDSRHGKRAGYDAGCRDDCCRIAARRAHKSYHLRALSMGGATTVPADRAAEVLTELAGRMSYSAIAKPLGTGHSYVTGIIRGKVKRISPEREAAILRLAGYVPDDTSHVDPLGARRRLQALHALGYTWRSLADATGIGLTTIKDVAYGEWPVIEGRNHATIAAVFDRLSMRLPTADTKHGRAGITRARKNAERRGWLPPMAWDDIDDPNERPNMRPLAHTPKSDVDEAVVLRVMRGEPLPAGQKMTTGERVEVVARLRARGWSLNEIETHTGIGKPERYTKGEAA